MEAFRQGHATSGLGAWLADHRISLAFTCLDVGVVALVGYDENREIAIHYAEGFPRAMGLGAHGSALFVAGRDQLWMLEAEQGVYRPRVAHFTGDVDAHDLAVDAYLRPVFVSTRFSCIATVTQHHSLAPIWKPPFVRALTPNDHCHLNGMGLRDGIPAYATCLSDTDTPEGWRKKPRGLVISVASGIPVTDELEMPHSPRIYRGQLYALDSVKGALCEININTGATRKVGFVPGFARGLAFAGDFAIVGCSRPREPKAAERLRGTECGVYIIPLVGGEPIHWLRLGTGVNEVFEVQTLTAAQPKIMGPRAVDLNERLSVDPEWRPLDPGRPYRVRVA